MSTSTTQTTHEDIKYILFFDQIYQKVNENLIVFNNNIDHNLPVVLGRVKGTVKKLQENPEENTNWDERIQVQYAIIKKGNSYEMKHIYNRLVKNINQLFFYAEKNNDIPDYKYDSNDLIQLDLNNNDDTKTKLLLIEDNSNVIEFNSYYDYHIYLNIIKDSKDLEDIDLGDYKKSNIKKGISTNNFINHKYFVVITKHEDNKIVQVVNLKFPDGDIYGSQVFYYFIEIKNNDTETNMYNVIMNKCERIAYGIFIQKQFILKT